MEEYIPDLITLAIALVAIVMNNREWTRVHTLQIKMQDDKVRTLERDLSKNISELFNRTRFVMTTQEVIDHLDKSMHILQRSIDKYELHIDHIEKRIMEEVKELRREVNAIRQDCSNCPYKRNVKGSGNGQG